MKIRVAPTVLLVFYVWISTPLAECGIILDCIAKNQSGVALPNLDPSIDATVLAVRLSTPQMRFQIVSEARPEGIPVPIPADMLDPGDTDWFSQYDPDPHKDPDYHEDKSQGFRRLARWPRVLNGVMPLGQAFELIIKFVLTNRSRLGSLREVRLLPRGVAIVTAASQPLKNIVSATFLRWKSEKWDDILVDLIPAGLVRDVNWDDPSIEPLWRSVLAGGAKLTALNPITGSYVADGKIQPANRQIPTAAEIRVAIDKAQRVAPIDRPTVELLTNDSLLVAAFSLTIYPWQKQSVSPDASIQETFLALGLRQPPIAYHE